MSCRYRFARWQEYRFRRAHVESRWPVLLWGLKNLLLRAVPGNKPRAVVLKNASLNLLILSEWLLRFADVYLWVCLSAVLGHYLLGFTRTKTEGEKKAGTRRTVLGD